MSPRRSQLADYETEIQAWRSQGLGFRRITTRLLEEFGLSISHNAVYSFLETLSRNAEPQRRFYDDLPEDIRTNLLQQIVNQWTHDSTALEGNTLTLGDTTKILEHGLTIDGKPLREHQEVHGHASAIDLIHTFTQRDTITDKDLFELHRCIMPRSAVDSLRPIGDWKRDYNGTTGIVNGKQIYMEYATPDDTPRLMKQWLKEYNRKLNSAASPTKAINVYTWAHMSLVRIHPFFDGNGRLARLIANLPLLKCGQAPIVISSRSRATYIDMLWSYQQAVGQLQTGDRLLPPHNTLKTFKSFLRDEWKPILTLVKQAHHQAQQRPS